MASRAHRFPGDNTPLTGVHGGSAAAARLAIKDAKALRRQVFKVIARLDDETPRRDRMRPSRAARSAAVEQIIAVQGDNCSLCGYPFGHGRNAPTIDHVVPRARGGLNLGNRLIAHASCNQAKGNRLPTEQERAMLKRVNAALGIAIPSAVDAPRKPVESRQPFQAVG